MVDVDQRLIKLAEEAIKTTPVDFGIAWMGGRRTAEEQFSLFIKKVTTKDGINNLSKHQTGQAFDIIPFVGGKVKENDWNYAMIASAILIKAKELELHIRTGSDWNENGEYITDESFRDIGHFELMM